MLNLKDAQQRKIADVTKFNKFKALQGIPGIFSKYGFTTSPKKNKHKFPNRTSCHKSTFSKCPF